MPAYTDENRFAVGVENADRVMETACSAHTLSQAERCAEEMVTQRQCRAAYIIDDVTMEVIRVIKGKVS